MKIKMKKKNDRIIYFYCYDLNKSLKKGELKKYYIGKANIIDFIRSYLFENPKLNYVQCLKRRDRYFIVRKRNRILSLGRICYRNTEEVDLDPHEASLISLLTVEAYRGRGMCTALIKEMMVYLKKQGYTKCSIWTYKNNIPSRKVIE